MKKVIFSFVLTFFFVAMVQAKAPEKLAAPLTERQVEAAVDNLLIGLDSNNKGLKVSSVYMLGELKSNRGVIPLLRVLRSGNTEEERLMAALSLYKIGDSRGIYAIKQAVKFDDSERVSEICKKFYLAYLNN